MSDPHRHTASPEMQPDSPDTGSLPEIVSGELKKCGLLPDETPYIVGVSAGVDSMVLLSVLAITLKYRVIVVHINYGKRGAASDSDEALVRTFCSRHDIPLEVYHAGDSFVRGNFQDYARKLRRKVMLSVMKQQGARAIFLGHHRDDQTETIFQKILRGAAIEFLRGMQVVDLPWVRPLLTVTRKQLKDYAVKHSIPYRTDATNLESDYGRNLLRNQVFPLLEQYFPGWQKNIRRISRSGTVHEKLLDFVVDQVTETRKNDLVLNRDRWIELPQELRTAVARHWIRRQTAYTDWTRGDVTRLADLEHIQTGKKISTGGRYFVLRDREYFVIIAGNKTGNESETGVQKNPEPDHPGKTGNDNPAGKAESDIPAYGTESDINEEICMSRIQKSSLIVGEYKFSSAMYDPDKTSGALQLRWDILPECVQLRRWQHGDRIQPLGMRGKQLISDLLTNRKISSAQKNQTLVLVSFDGNVHAVIFPHSLKSGEIGTIAEHTRCHSKGQRVLLIHKTG